MPGIRALAVVSIAFAAAIAIAACGGGNDRDPQEVVNEAFDNQQGVDSGAFDVSLDISTEGGEDPGSFKVTAKGPFQEGQRGLPSFDVTAELEADTETQDLSLAGGLISTGQNAFVSFQDSDYAVPQELFDRFVTTYSQLQDQNGQQGQEGSGFLKTLGSSLTDLENEGTEDVEGTETIHVSGRLDTPRLVEGLQTLSQATGQDAQPVTPEQLSQLEESVKSSDVDLYAGEEDGLVRRFDLSLELEPPPAEGAPDSASIDFSITLSKLNEPQEITGPASARPLAELLNMLGLDLGGAGGGGTGKGGGGLQGGLGATPPQAGGSPSPPSDDSTQAYLECLQTARGVEAVQKCEELLER